MTRRRKMRRFVMRPVRSSLITHAGWFSVGLLVLRLKSGDVWCYRVIGEPMWWPEHDSGVQSVWRSFLRSKSKGRWFNRRVKGKLEGVKLDGPSKATIESYIRCDWRRPKGVKSGAMCDICKRPAEAHKLERT